MIEVDTPEWIDRDIKNEQVNYYVYGAVWEFSSVENYKAGNID